MPTYDYVCNACGHAFEAFHSITAPPLKKCPACAKPKLKRLIGTGAGVIFKGSGFYETDYRSDSYKTAAKADKEASTTTTSASSSSDSNAKSDAGNTAKTETKTEAKSDAKPAPAAKTDAAPAGKKPTKNKAS